MKTPPETFDRRRFFKVLGGGVAVLFLADAAHAQGRRRGGGRGGNRPMELAAWLHISEDGTITAYTGKTEVGQNIRTSLAMVVAEELRVPLGSVRMIMADTDLVPFDAGTFGSRTTPDMASHLRRAAATLRGTLAGLAAETWGIEASEPEVRDGKVMAKDGRTLAFGEITRGRKLIGVVSADAAVTPAGKWKLAGTSPPKANGRDFVTGKHRFTADIRLPGMLHGKVLRAPAFGAKLRSLDPEGAEKLAKIVRDGDFAGAVASTAEEAAAAVAAMETDWETGPRISESELFERLKPDSSRQPEAHEGIGKALSESAHRLEERYTVAYIAHAPLEPRAAVAEWKDGKLTVWTGTQRPFGVKGELMSAFGLPDDRVRVIVPDTGSGYGGKHSGEAAVEAARLAKGTGAPVKLVWTREEEFTWAYFRPAGVIEVRSGITADGRLTAWDFHNYNSGGAAIATPYDVPQRRTDSHGGRSPLRQGSYRGLASAANAFARESHMDGLASLAGLDPLEFRLKNLKDARLRAVLEAAAERFGWGKGKAGPGRGSGLACGIDKGGYIATCAEVEVSEGAVKVLRIAAAFECGAILHPGHVKGQVEGSIVMGLGGALFEAISFAEGRILNPAFSKYRVPRFSDVPPIDVVLVDRKDLPSAGAGEAPILAIAPAIGNAIHSATGKRIRSLPMNPGL